MKNADGLNLAHPHVEQSLKMETGEEAHKVYVNSSMG